MTSHCRLCCLYVVYNELLGCAPKDLLKQAIVIAHCDFNDKKGEKIVKCFFDGLKEREIKQ